MAKLSLLALAAVLAVVQAQELDFEVPGKCIGPNFFPTRREDRMPDVFRPAPEGSRIFGSRGRVLRRAVRPAYVDGVSRPSGSCTRAQVTNSRCPNPGEHILENGERLGSVRPLARLVSNVVIDQKGVIGSERGLSDIIVHWGQMLAHDTELTPPSNIDEELEPLRIQIPNDDPVFDRNQPMDFFRSVFEFRCTGEKFNSPRQQLNLISAFIDGTFVYGGTTNRTQQLRLKRGGRMRLVDGLPPRAKEGDEVDNPRGEPIEELFFCGDVRCNEAIGLLSLITLFLKEHNRFADIYLDDFPRAPDDAVFSWSRRMVIATIQSITFNEYLPALFGRRLRRYEGFKRLRSSGLDNIFSSAARRFGHSQINPTVDRIIGRRIRRIQLDRTLYRVNRFVTPQIGVAPFIEGFFHKRAQQMDPHIDSAVRNRLFEAKPRGMLRDLAATNIQRGRDHGLPDFGTIRQRFRLQPVFKSTDDISHNETIRSVLRTAYGGNINLVDLFVGGLAEDRELGSEFGQTFTRILLRNFLRIRDGDRFWYERILSPKDLVTIRKNTLRRVIERNTELKRVPRNIFFDRRFCLLVLRNQCIPRTVPREAIQDLKELAQSRIRTREFLEKLVSLGILTDLKSSQPPSSKR